jgi:glycosyltransferase involved in cell wall biosynthesis
MSRSPGARARRVLVVAYDFPPHGAIGTMRTLRVVQRLADDGWEVRVLTSDPRTYRAGTPVEEGLIARVPAGVTILRAGTFRGLERAKRILRRARPAPHVPVAATPAPAAARVPSQGRLARAADLLEAALSIPDHESGWIVPAIARGLWHCVRWRPDVIYSSSPPWSGQVAAAALAAALRRPWVADFRDPWARAPWRVRRAFITRANLSLERMVVGRADAIQFVTRANLDEFATFYGPEVARRFHVVPNGCDPSEFAGLTPDPTPGPFVLLHAGTLYGARNPLPIVRAIARAVERGALARDAFRLRLLGGISLDVDLATECRKLGVEDMVEMIPRVTRAESLQQMVSASALLLVQPVTTVSVPGKAYEYLAAGRPLVALSEEGETAELVRASGIGVSVRPEDDLGTIEAALLDVVRVATHPYPPPPPALYDGRVQAATTAALLAGMATGSPSQAQPRDAVPAPPAVVSAEDGPR